MRCLRKNIENSKGGERKKIYLQRGILSGLTRLKRVEYHWSIIMYTGSTMIDPCAPLRPTWKNGLVISCIRLTYANVNATISTECRVDGSGGEPPDPSAKFPPKPRSGDFDSGQERAARIRHEINNKISQFRVWRVAPENHGSPLNAYITRPRDGEFLAFFPSFFS